MTAGGGGLLFRAVLVVAVAAAALGAPTPLGGEAAVAAAGRDVIVVLEAGGDPARVAREMGVEVEHVYRHVFTGFAGRVPAGAVAGLGRDRRVAAIVDDERLELAGTALPAGIDRVDADRNPGAAIDGREAPAVDADVAVLDSGIDPDHPDLNVAGGYDCTGGGSWRDDNGHGTHVAGTIGAKDDGVGVVGVAPGARLWAVKVLGADNRYGSISTVICGLDWVVGRGGIDAVNLSLGGAGAGGPCSSSPFHEAICRTVGSGVTVVAAAMNDGADAGGYAPATYDEVVTVSAFADFDGKPGGVGRAPCGAADGDDRFAGFSNYGGDVDIAAPGVCVRSTIRGGGTGMMSGTSMAAPHVAGAVALYKAEHPGADAAEVRRWLLGTATRAQGSAVGFGGDPDGSAEPVLALDLVGGGEPAADGPQLEIVGSGKSSGSSAGALAYDGDATSAWTTTGAKPPRGASIRFDLDGVQALERVRWQFSRVGGADSYKIQVSDDGRAWRTLASRRGPRAAGEWVTLAVEPGTEASSVRFLFANPRGDRRLGYLSEVAIFGG